MTIVQTNPNSKILEIDNSLFEDVKEFLKNLTIKKQKNFSYIDELGDLIVVENGKEYVIPTKEDIINLNNTKKEDFFNENEAKRLLGVWIKIP